ncbi:MAG: sigma-70 family RNA polymerase sigma factor [Caulobacteraceae bacterium]|nr:sigma-70 family RNA polymerase sigma factor [Caulobacteraceae bacterium]
MDYNELYKYIKSLFHSYFNKYRLEKEEVEDIIQNVMMNIYIKEKENKISNSIEENKNYIFISIKNHIYRNHKRKQIISFTNEIPENKHIFDLRDDNTIDNGILSNIILNVLKSKNFNEIERLLIINLLKNGTPNEFKKRENISNYDYNRIFLGIKLKIKTKLFPNYKYLFTTDDGYKYFFTNKFELKKFLKMSVDTLNTYLSLGRTKFKNGTLTYL